MCPISQSNHTRRCFTLNGCFYFKSENTGKGVFFLILNQLPFPPCPWRLLNPHSWELGVAPEGTGMRKSLPRGTITFIFIRISSITLKTLRFNLPAPNWSFPRSREFYIALMLWDQHRRRVLLKHRNPKLSYLSPYSSFPSVALSTPEQLYQGNSPNYLRDRKQQVSRASLSSVTVETNPATLGGKALLGTGEQSASAQRLHWCHWGKTQEGGPSKWLQRRKGRREAEKGLWGFIWIGYRP